MKLKNIFLIFLLAGSASAQSASKKLGEILSDYLCSIFEAVTSIVGVIAVLVLVAAGMRWLWSKEEPGERKQAKSMIENVLTGLTICIAATGIVFAILKINPCIP